MDFANITNTVVSVVAGIVGAWATLNQLKKNHEKELESKIQKAIELTQENIESEVKLMTSKIDGVQKEVENLEDRLEKDLLYIKERHSSGMDNLTEKIDNLRDEVRSAQSQLMALLTKLIEEKSK